MGTLTKRKTSVSDGPQHYVTLVETRTLGRATNIRDMLLAGGIPEVNVWPARHFLRYAPFRPHVITIPEGNLGEARRLLSESGLLEP